MFARGVKKHLKTQNKNVRSTTKTVSRISKNFFKSNFLESCAFLDKQFAKIAGPVTLFLYDLEC